ncbi:MAG: hypothetical protein GY878_07380 [Fuerstiella sp.]|nr:hypothetical protein [Fuerstiella sp.]
MHESTQSRLDEMQTRRKANTFTRCPAKHVTTIPRAVRASGEPLLSSVGNRLHEIIRRETGADIPCAACEKEINALNLMTAKEARGERERVVDGIYSRAWGHARWQDKIKLLADKALSVSTAGKVNVGKDIIGGWFDEAIEAGALRMRVKKHRQGRRGRGGAGAGIERRRANRLTMPLSKLQKRLHEAALAAPPPEPFPFVGEPVRNMIWHVWPVEGWRRHVERIKDLAATCDGQRIVGLSISPDSETADTVRGELGDGYTYLEFMNKGQGDGTGSGEVQTLRAALPMLDAADPDSITIYGHCKGVRPHTRDMEAVHLWCDLMWEMVALNYEQATAAMEAGYQMFGAFRTFGGMPLQPAYSWHYSGTFFQFRTASLLENGITPVKGGYGGTEAWPGDCVLTQYAHCVFGDGLGFKAPYDVTNWPAWIDQVFEWEVNRIGGPRTEQHKRELDWLLDRLDGVRSMLVIGSKHGGLEYHISQRYPQMEIISVDIAPQADNAAQHVHVGSSADPVLRDLIRAAYNFDAVFIDGDHTLAGVTADWEFAQTLEPSRIYFHDIHDGLKHRREGCQVDQLWANIKQDHKTAEKIVGVGWGGIGEVLL